MYFLWNFVWMGDDCESYALGSTLKLVLLTALIAKDSLHPVLLGVLHLSYFGRLVRGASSFLSNSVYFLWNFVWMDDDCESYALVPP